MEQRIIFSITEIDGVLDLQCEADNQELIEIFAILLDKSKGFRDIINQSINNAIEKAA